MKMIRVFALALAALAVACQSPDVSINTTSTTATSAGGTSPQAPGAPAIASFGQVAKQSLNLGVTQTIPLTITPNGSFSGGLKLTVDTTTLRLSDPGSKVSFAFTPATVSVSPGHGASTTLTVTVDPAAPALDSTFNVVATPANGDASVAVSFPVAIQVNAVYEIDFKGAPATGGTTPEVFSAPSVVSFASHPNGILIRFVNLDTRAAHEVHSSGTPIPHQGTTAASQSSTGPQPSTLVAATANGPGGKYEYMVTTQSKVSDTYYCHIHESGTDAHTLVFNAFAAVAPPKPTTNPNATFSYINSNVLQPKCVSCHGTSGGYSFASYSSTVKAVTSGQPTMSPLYLSVAPGGTMPQGGSPLSATDVQAISDWIGAGAPNN